jgi:hypothetical protein
LEKTEAGYLKRNSNISSLAQRLNPLADARGYSPAA